MKVLLLSPIAPPPGGIARWTEQFVNWCKKNDISVEVINTSVTGKRVTQANSSKNLLDEIIRALKIILKTKKKTRKTNYDILHVNTSCSKSGMIRDYICTLIAKKKKIPLILHCHCNISDQLGNSKSSQFLFNLLVCNASRVLVLNSKSYDFVAAFSKKKVELCSNFIEYESVNQRFFFNDNIKRILYVGNICLSKGAGLVLDAAKHNPEIEFRLVGLKSNEFHYESCSSNVTFCGQLDRDEVINELDMADIFLFPSYSEGFSVALLEAMSRGLPVIASNVGANYDMLKNKGGYILNGFLVEEINKALKELEDKDKRIAMSNWNVDRVRNEFVLSIVLNKLISIYKDCIESACDKKNEKNY